MAASDELTQWLLDQSEPLNLQATAFTWTRDWGMGDLHDIQVSIDVGGRTFVGRGSALDEDLAFLKAGSEAIERAYCAGHGIHSTGVAAHTDDALAEENARRELNERDAFFCHFYTQTPFTQEDGNIIRGLMDTFPGAFERVANHGVTIGFFLARGGQWPVVLCVATGLKASPAWGGIVGLGSHSNERKAALAAFFECMRNVSATVLNGLPPLLSRQEFYMISDPSPRDRQRLALNIDYWREMMALFLANDRAKDAQAPLAPTFSCRIEKLEFPFIELKSAPVVVYRARFDDTKDDSLYRPKDRSPTTLRRLAEFLGHAVTVDGLEQRPHFLG